MEACILCKIEVKRQDCMQKVSSIGHFLFMVWDTAFYLVKLITYIRIHIITLHVRQKYAAYINILHTE